MKPFFSIIIPTYNRANFLTKAINSVISQTFENWELIIVDDGSTDNTKVIVNEFEVNDNRIKYVYQKNSERSAARNNGISKALGDWICFLDSDDVYHADHLNEFAKLIKSKNNTQGLYFSGLSFDEFQLKDEYYNLLGKCDLEFVLLNTLATPRACIAKSILEKEKFNTKLRIGEDTELWTRIAARNNTYFHTKKTYIQVEHDNRSVNQNSALEHLKTLNYIFKNPDIYIRINIRHQLL